MTGRQNTINIMITIQETKKKRTLFREETPVQSHAGASQKQEESQVDTEQSAHSQVSDAFLCLNNRPDNFITGTISLFFDEWAKLTNDKFILHIVSHGYEIEFESEPCEESNRKPINFNLKEQDIISSLLNKFENKGVVVETEHEEGEILSNIFIRP